MYLAALSEGIIGSGNLYDDASRSHAPDDIADVHFEDADSVSPIEIACCQLVEVEDEMSECDMIIKMVKVE